MTGTAAIAASTNRRILRRLLALAPLLLVALPAWGQTAAPLPGPPAASLATLSAGTTAQIAQATILIGALALAPSLLVMTTAFTRIVIVLSLLRSAIGAQGAPPNIVLIGLALFLTWFVMAPVAQDAWTHGLLPLQQGQLALEPALTETLKPLRHFMQGNLRADDMALYQQIAKLPPNPAPDQVELRVLIPAFVTGELRRAFEMGFYLYLPFVVIDLVVASVLMGLGMVMLPPNAVSLPFKLIFFVSVDGWQLAIGGLARSFAGH